MKIELQDSGKALNISMKLQNLIHFRALFFANHVYFTLHDRPPVLKAHNFWVAFI